MVYKQKGNIVLPGMIRIAKLLQWEILREVESKPLLLSDHRKKKHFTKIQDFYIVWPCVWNPGINMNLNPHPPAHITSSQTLYWSSMIVQLALLTVPVEQNVANGICSPKDELFICGKDKWEKKRKKTWDRPEQEWSPWQEYQLQLEARLLLWVCANS